MGGIVSQLNRVCIAVLLEVSNRLPSHTRGRKEKIFGRSLCFDFASPVTFLGWVLFYSYLKIYLNKFENLSNRYLKACLATVQLQSVVVQLWYYFCHRWRKLKLLRVRLLTASLFLNNGLNMWKIMASSLNSEKLFDTIFLTSSESFPLPQGMCPSCLIWKIDL